MDTSLIGAALAQLKTEPGYELVKAYIQPVDDMNYVILLLDYGIGGCKKYRVEVTPELLTAKTPPPEEGETVEEVRKTAKRRR